MSGFVQNELRKVFGNEVKIEKIKHLGCNKITFNSMPPLIKA
jgi:hypothetical protein